MTCLLRVPLKREIHIEVYKQEEARKVDQNIVRVVVIMFGILPIGITVLAGVAIDFDVNVLAIDANTEIAEMGVPVVLAAFPSAVMRVLVDLGVLVNIASLLLNIIGIISHVVLVMVIVRRLQIYTRKLIRQIPGAL